LYALALGSIPNSPKMPYVFEIPMLLAARGGQKPPPEWLIMLILVLSALLAATAVCLWIRVRNRLSKSIYAEGEVIRYLEIPEGRGRTSKAPVIRYTASDGSSHLVNSSVFSNPPAFNIGDRIQVVYTERKPHEAEYVGLFAQWGVVMITGGMAVVLFILGLAFRAF
jgi:hypothetical protein